MDVRAQRQMNSRIVHFLINNQLIPLVCSCDYQSTVISDHTPVLSIILPVLPQIKTESCFNSTLLADDAFVKFLEDQKIFLNTKALPETSSLIIWETLKAHLRGQIISYTAHMKRRAHKVCLELAKQIKEKDQQYAHVKSKTQSSGTTN